MHSVYNLSKIPRAAAGTLVSYDHKTVGNSPNFAPPPHAENEFLSLYLRNSSMFIFQILTHEGVKRNIVLLQTCMKLNSVLNLVYTLTIFQYNMSIRKTRSQYVFIDVKRSSTAPCVALSGPRDALHRITIDSNCVTTTVSYAGACQEIRLKEIERKCECR